MHKSSGFTEAELMAAEWSKQNKLKKLAIGGVGAKSISRPSNSDHNSIYGPASSSYNNKRSDSRDRHRSTSDHYKYRYDPIDLKSNSSISRDNLRDRSRDRDRTRDRKRDRSNSRKRDKHDDHSTSTNEVDEFGRVRTKTSSDYHQKSSSSKSERRSTRRSRSRSRSLSSSPVVVRRREYDDEENDKREREKERLREERERAQRLNNEWRHDMFNRNEDSPERRPLADDPEMREYRPPSPTWVSKAGGVAIMRKKIYE